MSSPRRPLILAGLLLALLTLGACSVGPVAEGTPGAPPAATRLPFRARFATPTPPATLQPRPTAASAAANTSPRAIVRTFTDAGGRTITLYYGRAVGRRGDWGWAHILGKHLRGEWYDGGPVTTFKEVAVTTPEEVQDLIDRTLLQDARPDAAAGGRREYRLPLSARHEMLVVVGNDGAIITAYPDSAPRRRP